MERWTVIWYFMRRVLSLIVIMLGLTIIMFAMSRLLPTDPARAAAGLEAGPDQILQARHELGLDRPLPQQYLHYLGGLLHGDLGQSVATKRPVRDDLGAYLPATLELVFGSLVLVVVLGVLMGIVSAMWKGRALDAVIRLFSYFGAGMPVFWIGLVLQIIFYGRLGLLPSGGRLGVGTIPPTHVTGLFLLDSLLAGNLGGFFQALKYLILPVLALSLGRIAVVARMTRASFLGVLEQDYIRTAHSKGLATRTILLRHALRNAAIPILTTLGLQLGWMLGGTLLVEEIFSWPGIGLYAAQSVTLGDFPAIMGVVLVICLGFVLTNFIIDVLYMVVNPRIRY